MDFYHSPATISNHDALKLAQSAEEILSETSQSSFSFPISLLFPSAEREDNWLKLESAFYACLRTSNNALAERCLSRIDARFGDGGKNERVLALKGLFEEAVLSEGKGLENVLSQYRTTLETDPTNIPIYKRKVALLKSLNRTDEAIAALVELVSLSPIDAEAWAELSDLYLSVNMFPQAIYSLEEVLVLAPTAWNIHARLGELLYMSTLEKGITEADKLKALTHSIRRFCRSIELCDNYLRGFYGLALASQAYLSAYASSSFSPASASRKDKEKADQAAADADLSSPEQVQKLLTLSKQKLQDFVSSSSSTLQPQSERKDGDGNDGSTRPREDGYSAGEVAAAKVLLEELEQ